METALKNNLVRLMPNPIVKRKKNLVAVSTGESGSTLFELRRNVDNSVDAIKRTINPMSNGEAISDLEEATADRLLPALLTEKEWELALSLWQNSSTQDSTNIELTEEELKLVETIVELTDNVRIAIREAMHSHFYSSFDDYDS
ncbi:hypothetical protein HOF56_04630 [Candidatus Peribacteria bacterium]|jgi:hypothetical protein|nr:hypothetical protein [Candidatus Peribacteria bacterium]MBT4021111.1 hypothetical protein [Candidatus Peribacteria bacterium]